jgi:hypothetical protein
MRTDLMPRENVVHFNANAKIQPLLAVLRTRGRNHERVTFSVVHARALKASRFALEGIGAQGDVYERLDQRTIELLPGVR